CYHQHHGEVAAEDGHRRVLEVAAGVEEGTRDGGDDPWPVGANRADGEVGHGRRLATPKRTAAADTAGPRRHPTTERACCERAGAHGCTADRGATSRTRSPGARPRPDCPRWWPSRRGA